MNFKVKVQTRVLHLNYSYVVILAYIKKEKEMAVCICFKVIATFFQTGVRVTLIKTLYEGKHNVNEYTLFNVHNYEKYSS